MSAAGAGKVVSVEAIAGEILDCLGSGRAAARHPAMDFAQAYAVVARIRALREARGERCVGRKIGFTNVTIWSLYGVEGPMWNFMYDTTVRELADLAGGFELGKLAEPRIEPEIVLHLGRAPEPGMTAAELIGCVDWVAHGFEIVQSVYPGWRFSGPEAAAAFGLHGALMVGPRHAIGDDRAGWAAALAGFGVTLARGGDVVAEGHASHVLGGPIDALRFLVEEIARFPGNAPLQAGEIVTTGTLTDAQPVRPGERWSTALEGIGIDGIAVEFR